jgi:hypothetical protein
MRRARFPPQLMTFARACAGGAGAALGKFRAAERRFEPI